MKTEASPRKKRNTADFTLIAKRVEAAVLKGRDTEELSPVLANRRLWQLMDEDQLLHWSALAQMAGQMQTALDVMAFLNQKSPQNEKAWVRHLELLGILGRQEEGARLLARMKPVVAEESYQRLLKDFGAFTSPPSDRAVESALEPFERLRLDQQRIAAFMRLFRGRQGCFARQWADRNEQKQGYVPVRRPMTATDVQEHFRGLKTYGIYLLKEDNSVGVGVIDADLVQAFRRPKLPAAEKRLVLREKNFLLARIAEKAKASGMSPLVEFSGGKGFHFWFVFENPLPAARVRTALGVIRDAVAPDLTAFNLEVFPKQDRLSGKGFGNLVKLPLGVHRLSGRRSWLVDCTQKTLEAQLDYLLNIAPTPVEAVVTAAATPQKAAVTVHPRWQGWADKYPELFALEQKCPPLGQIIASCRTGTVLSTREEKVVFQTIGFLPRAKTLLHYLCAFAPEYNPHLVDFRISRLRGKPLGCKRIHSLMGFTADYCEFAHVPDYPHPLLHLKEWDEDKSGTRCEKIDCLGAALENLETAIARVRKYMT